MSTLTSSPSPGISPRTSFRIQKTPSYTAPSATVASPRSTWSNAPSLSTSPRFSANAAALARNSSPTIPIYHPNTQSKTLAPERPSRYVDVGTQYSPDGYPPTAGRNYFIPPMPAESRAVIPAQTQGKKRKELDSPEPMVTPGDSSGSSVGNPPPEPEPRRDPSAPQSAVIASSSADPAALESTEARSTHGHSSAPKRSKPEPGVTKVMPVRYENCNAQELGHLISNMLMELIRINDRIPLRDGRLTRFHSRAPPGISVSDYLQRLIRHATLSPPILLSMVHYIDRLCQLYPIFTINSLTVHRFLITAATVAAKGLSDAFWTNPTYARVGGIPVSELATLELEFLDKMHWRIVPKPEVLEEYYVSLITRTEGYMLEDQVDGSEESSGDESDDAIGEEERNGNVNEEDGDEDEEMADDPS